MYLIIDASREVANTYYIIECFTRMELESTIYLSRDELSTLYTLDSIDISIFDNAARYQANKYMYLNIDASGEVANTYYIIDCFTRMGLESTIYRLETSSVPFTPLMWLLKYTS